MYRLNTGHNQFIQSVFVKSSFVFLFFFGIFILALTLQQKLAAHTYYKSHQAIHTNHVHQPHNQYLLHDKNKLDVLLLNFFLPLSKPSTFLSLNLDAILILNSFPASTLFFKAVMNKTFIIII